MNSETQPITPPKISTVFTGHIPSFLNSLGISLAITTRESQHIFLMRAFQGQINIFPRFFNQPLGLAINQNKIAISTSNRICQFRNIPALAKNSPPIDACFVLAQTHVTGKINVHDMGFVNNQLWFVNTAFSCLCTLDNDHSFVPRWQPPFISAYDLSDRCHLNGLGIRDNQPRYLTALAMTDTAEGWRANPSQTGILIDIVSNELVAQNISFPHSPRWHNHQLWLLESGKGSLAKVNLNTGELETFAQLPGFTRGLAFCQDWAFIGVSKLTETPTPLKDTLKESFCGIWIINLKAQKIEGFIRFESGISEISALEIIPNSRFPVIIDSDENILASSFVLPDSVLQKIANQQPPQSQDINHQVDSFCVIIPVFNITRKNEVFSRTLASIEASIDYWKQQEPKSKNIPYEIVIVDDGSKDETWSILQDLTHNKPYYRLIKHLENKGQGAARNTGVNASLGKAIFFCDDDDLFLPEHIFLCLKMINQPVPGNNNPLYKIPGNYPGAVKTNVKMQDEINPYWYEKVKTALTINCCVRREAHYFIEGFPEDKVCQLCNFGLEDRAYNEFLTTCFSVVWPSQETVEYIRYPGNLFDKQLPRFQLPLGEYKEDIDPIQEKYLDQIETIISTRIQSLQQKAQGNFNTDYWFSLANKAYYEKDLAQAVKCYQQCLVFKPDWLVVKYNLGVVYYEQNNWQAGILKLEEVVTQEPRSAEAFNYLGIIYHSQNELEKAIYYYRKAIALRYKFPDAHFNLGITLLQAGQFEEGLKEHEWRWQRKDFTPLVCPRPKWDGSNIEDKSILIHTEQGAGDAIQYIRFIPLVTKLCKRVIICCTENLVNLFSTVEGISKIYTAGDIPLSEFDTYTPLMCLPYLLKIHKEEDFTIEIPYIGKKFLENKEKNKFAELMKNDYNKKIGIAWAGSPTHKNDHNRSTKLDYFAPLFDLPNLTFYTLQKGDRINDLAQFSSMTNMVNLDDYITDFDDTSEAIAHLDLIISIDTSVAHLAGALGKPVWILLCYCPDWRWMLERKDTPWYPTMRLFRQKQPQDWQGVFQEVLEAIQQI